MLGKLLPQGGRGLPSHGFSNLVHTVGCSLKTPLCS